MRLGDLTIEQIDRIVGKETLQDRLKRYFKSLSLVIVD